MPEEVKDEVVKEAPKETPQSAGEQQAAKDVPFSEHPRWKEVYGQNKEYKQYGSPAEIAARLERAAQLEQAFIDAQAAAAKAAEEANRTPDEKKQAELEEKARGELKKLLPELDEVEELRAERAARNSRLEAAAVSETRKIIGELGLPDNKEEVLAMCDILADIVKNDADLIAEYQTNPKAAVRGAHEKFASKFQAANARAAGAQKQAARESAAKLPKAHGAGGGSDQAEGASGPPKNLAEATKRAIERLKGVEL